MDRTNRARLVPNLSKYFPWFFYVITFFVAYKYTSNNIYNLVTLKMPSSQYTMWHDIFYQLNNGLLIPFQHWIGLYFIFFQATSIRTMSFSILRYSQKKCWYWNTLKELLIICCKTITLSYLCMFILGAIRFGIPHSMDWGAYPPINQPISIMLITSFLCRLNISFFAAVIYLLVTVWRNNGVFSYLVCLFFCFIAHLILLITPPYMSFKRIAFASCFTYHYISEGYFLENILNAFGLPLLFGIISIWITYNLLDHFPERGWQECE